MYRVLHGFWHPLACGLRSLVLLGPAILLADCSGGSGFSVGDLLSSSSPSPPAQPTTNIGAGSVKVGFILPLSGTGNAAVAAQSMRNAAEMALAEFSNPDIRLLVKDDAGSAAAAQQGAQQVLDEGAEIILGPLFALTVGPVGQLARPRNVPVIAFSTDANVAARGVYLLSFLPESDVERIVGYAVGQGRRSFAALVPDNAYGTVVEAAFKQVVARRGGRVVALERYPLDKAQMQGPVRNVAQAAARGADAIFIPDGAEAVAAVVTTLNSNGVDTKRVQLLGTGLWEDAQVFSNPHLEGGWYAGPDTSGFAASPPAIVDALARIPSAPPRLRTMPSRSLLLWSKLSRVRRGFPKKRSPTRLGLPGSMDYSVSVRMERTNAGLPSCG